MSRQSIRDRFPLRLLISGEDMTFLLDESFTFSNVDPGGYEMASFSFAKDLPQVLRGMPVKLDCGLQVAWEGRVKEVQRSLGAKTLIQCEGYGAKLKDTDMSMVYVDRDLTRWGSPGAQESVRLAKENETQGNASVSPAGTSGEIALVQSITGSWASPYRPMVESTYDAGPENSVAYIYYSLTPGTGAGGGSWENQLHVCEINGLIVNEGSGNQNNSGSGITSYFGPSTKTWRYAALTTTYAATPGGVEGAEYQAYWKLLAVYGNHGLTRRGSDPAGFYTSDIVENVISFVNGIKAGVIPQASSYTVPHSAYYTAVEAQQVVADMAKLVGYHWGVWESLDYLSGDQEPRLDFRPYPAQGNSTAWCWRSNCETLDVREDLSSQYNVAQVVFSEASGGEETVKVSVPNPILEAAGISERVIQLNLGTSVKAAAEEYGRIALVLLQEQARVVGSATLLEPVYRVGGGEIAPWMLRAGLDRLRIPDLASPDVWGAYNELPIARVECSGGEDGLKVSVELGQGANLLELLTSQLQQAAVLAG